VLAFLADENFSGRVVRGLRRRRPDLDIVRVQDIGLSGADDPAVLEWAARFSRIVLTHDVTTMTAHAYARVNDGLPMPGVFEIKRTVPVGRAIEEILICAECSFEGEWEGQVIFLPL
jgi:Domain of unknown function (DUF5615)